MHSGEEIAAVVFIPLDRENMAGDQLANKGGHPSPKCGPDRLNAHFDGVQIGENLVCLAMTQEISCGKGMFSGSHGEGLD